MEIVQRLTRILGFHNVKELIFPIFGSVGNGEHIHMHSSECGMVSFARFGN